MSDKKNDEKLRILQERLTQIKQKEEVTKITTPEEDIPQKEHTPKSSGWVKYVVICGISGIVIIGAVFGSFYVDFSNIFASSDKVTEETQEFVLEYNLNMPEDWIIAITASLEDESSAKAMVNDLKAKGYKCDYFFLPNKSNSKEEVYKVFIGPYENQDETNQWTKSLAVDFEIISL